MTVTVCNPDTLHIQIFVLIPELLMGESSSRVSRPGTSAPRNATHDDAKARHLPGTETVRTRVSGVGDNSVILDKVTERRDRGKLL